MIARGNATPAEVTGGKHRRDTVVPIRPDVLAAVMNDPAATGRQPFNPADCGYAAAYRRGEVNNCPGCGHCNWWLRNQTAECAFCSTALPIAG